VKTLVPQRLLFNGAELLSPAWTLQKVARSAVCTVWSRQFGFELRLAIDGRGGGREHAAPKGSEEGGRGRKKTR
jgi:hypothetical protein